MMKTREKVKQNSYKIHEMCVYAMFAALMFASKILMEALPNIHLIGMLVVLLTVTFRARALIPIYLFVMINGVWAGFSLWWIPYLYIWTLLWGMVMLLPRSMPRRVALVVYPLVTAMHGFLYGTLYAPAQALMYGFDFEQTLVWIASGFGFDLIHGVSNLFTGSLVIPLSALLRRLMKRSGHGYSTVR